MNPANYTTRLAELIRNAESGVQKLIADAARAGDYDTIDTARQVAVELRALAEGLVQNASDGHMTDTTEPKQPQAKRVASLKTPTQATVPDTKSLASTNGGKPQRGEKIHYPRFEARNDILYRIGWSKKSKKEYLHKVPRSSFDTIIEVLGQIANGTDSPVPAETVIEALDGDVIESIPTYQVYAVLMYLRQLDAIEQTGRDGYRIPADIARRKDALWPS